MDPKTFTLDGERLFQVLMTITTLSFFVERALAVVFENRLFATRLSGRGIKEAIAIAVALGVCRYWDYDGLSILFMRDKTALYGHALTATIIAGGSKASVKFFHDVLKAMSSAEEERRKVNVAEADAKPGLAGAPALGVGTRA